MNPTDVSNAVNAVINAYPNGSRIGFSGVEVGQCPAPVCEYMVRLGAPIPPMANDRADGWGTNFPGELAPFFIHETFQFGKQYPEGTIYMWNSPHIAFSVAPSDGSNTVKVFEQNADPDGHGCQVFNRIINTSSHTCTYVLIPIVKSLPPPPIFTITDTYPGGRNLKMTADHPRYQIDQNPVTPMGVQHKDDPIVAIKLASHINGQQYFIASDSDTTGWDTQDCYDYDPTPVPPVPYVPPFAPVPVKPATKIQLVTTVPTYPTPLDADNRNQDKSNGNFPAGDYYLFETTDTGMLNIGITNMGASVWINPKDNIAPIVPPEPETVIEPQVVTPSEPAPVLKPSEVAIGTDNDTVWKASYMSFHADRSPDTYEVLSDYVMKEYGGHQSPVKLTEGRRINVVGTFIKNGIKFYRPRDYKNDVTFSWYYGVPMFDDQDNPMMRKVQEETPQQHLSDLWHLWRDDLKNYLGTNKVWDVLFKHKRRK